MQNMVHSSLILYKKLLTWMGSQQISYHFFVQSGEYLHMILHLSKWIGEKSLAEGNLKTALDVELRNMKRALVISCMEQLCRGYANGKPCKHLNPEPDCDCFYVKRNEVKGRVSEIQKMASRLDYASSNWSSAGHTNWFSSNMRMREVRLYWLASEDPIIVRNAHLLNKKSQNGRSKRITP